MRHRIDVQKFLDDLSTEGIASSTRAEAELVPIGVRIAPHQVRHWSLMGNLSESVDDLYLVEAVNAGAQTPMHAEYIVVDDDAQGEEVKHVGEIMPHACISILPIAFRIESVRLGDTS